ncbi:MAG: hypothetical protein WA040_00005, partial [Anaerolineae bacterium]
ARAGFETPQTATQPAGRLPLPLGEGWGEGTPNSAGGFRYAADGYSTRGPAPSPPGRWLG